jgi:hypothetical protein
MDGAVQVLGGGSPAEFQIRTPTGPDCDRGRIRPLVGQRWPRTRPGALNAAEIEYVCGYPDVGSPLEPDVPEELVTGMLLVIGELYKVRTLSIVGVMSTPAVLQAQALWMGYRVR